MLGKLLKLYLYAKRPRTTFILRHPKKAARVAKLLFYLRTVYALRLTVLATALLVGPFAYRLGRRSAEGTLYTPRSRPARRLEEVSIRVVPNEPAAPGSEAPADAG